MCINENKTRRQKMGLYVFLCIILCVSVVVCIFILIRNHQINKIKINRYNSSTIKGEMFTDNTIFPEGIRPMVNLADKAAINILKELNESPEPYMNGPLFLNHYNKEILYNEEINIAILYNYKYQMTVLGFPKHFSIIVNKQTKEIRMDGI